MAGVNVANLPQVGRVPRRPQHRYQLAWKPWQIQPFMLAPVLPGETMKNLLVQARVVSDPILNPLIGWWVEHYFFYVKHRDLLARDLLTQMMLDPETDLSSLNSAANVKNYHYGGTIDWVALCMERIVDEYFRDEGDEPGDFMIDGLYAAKIADNSWLDSVTRASDMTFDDVDVDADADGNITAGEVDAAMRNWQFMKANKLTEMSYEDFLRTYGVRVARTELHKPELVRYLREWTYPTNTVEASTGIPSTALSWSITDRADKDRFFAEPGFLVGCAVVRPKVYLGKQSGSAAGVMNNALAWLPAIMRDDPYTSLKLQAKSAAGPLTGQLDDYWIDVRDLFMYGDQFRNIADAAGLGSVALPSPALQKRYASITDADALFSGTAKTVRADGVVSLTVHGTLVDQT